MGAKPKSLSVSEDLGLMTWYYVSFGILGALTPIIVFYVVHYDRKIPGTPIDLGLVFYGAGVTVVLIPIGIGFALTLAVVFQFCWRFVSR